MECVEFKKVNDKDIVTVNYPECPEYGKTIENYLDVNELVSRINKVNYYLEKPKECHFEIGTWVVEFFFKDGRIMVFKYPQKISEERFKDYLKPILDRLGH